jgi:hypothetical protein
MVTALVAEEITEGRWQARWRCMPTLNRTPWWNW